MALLRTIIDNRGVVTQQDSDNTTLLNLPVIMNREVSMNSQLNTGFDLVVTGSMTVNGDSTIAGSQTVSSDLTVDGVLQAVSSAIVGENLVVLGSTTLSRNTSNYGYYPYGISAVQFTASAQLTPGDAGVIYMSSSVGTQGFAMPLAANAPGAMFTIVNGNSGVSHILTSSLETGGTLAFAEGTTYGSRIILDSTLNSSIVLQCDGFSWIVLGSRGAHTINGT